MRKPGPEPGVHSVWEGPDTIDGKTIRQAVKPLEAVMPIRFLGWGEVGAAALLGLLQTDPAATPAVRQRRERAVEQSIGQHVQCKRTEDGLSAPTGAGV